MTTLWALAIFILLGALGAIVWHSPIVLVGLVLTFGLLFAAVGLLASSLNEVADLERE